MKTITVDELKARMDAGEKLNVIDVREDIERADFNIGGTHFRLRSYTRDGNRRHRGLKR